MSGLNRLVLPLAVALTLGLAPFTPEPHVVEKLRWLAQGQPFQPVDVFDSLLHGLPWVWLIVTAGILVVGKLRP